MKYIPFYMFNILACIPIGICLIIFTAIMGITLGASGEGYGIVFVLLVFVYLYINYKWSCRLRNQWIHFFLGTTVGICCFGIFF